MPPQDVNPYEAPRQSSLPSPSVPEVDLRARGLVSVSLLFFVLIEVFPTEADITVVAVMHKDLPTFLVAKAVCLAVILAPLLFYLYFNGWRGFLAAKGRICLIVVLIVLRLGFEIAVVAHRF
jgi:hypothetical protein